MSETIKPVRSMFWARGEGHWVNIWRLCDIPAGIMRSTSRPEISDIKTLLIDAAKSDQAPNYVFGTKHAVSCFDYLYAAVCARDLPFSSADWFDLIETEPSKGPVTAIVWRGHQVNLWQIKDVPNGTKRTMAWATITDLLDALKVCESKSRGPSDIFRIRKENPVWIQTHPNAFVAVLEEDLSSLSKAYGATLIDDRVRLPQPIESKRDLRHLGAASGELVNRKQISDKDRQEWSAQLRQLTKQAEEKERNRVLVDLEYEYWE